MGINSRLIRDRLIDRPHFIAALTDASQGRFVPVPGGVLIRDGERRIVGAVGISGDTSERDEFAGIVGVKAAGLTPDPPEPAPDWKASRL
jgi:uncharacterized protein GlcG (DUF336 family)